jgi:hypothetical protein
MLTDKLLDSIKEGDVLYFYTDSDSFEEDKKVEYMVVITKNLLNCTQAELISAATIVDPFSFKYISSANIENNTYLMTTKSVVSVNYNTNSTNNSSVLINGFNMANMLSYDNKSALILGNMTDSSTNNLMTFKTSSDELDIYNNKDISNNIYNKIKTDNNIPVKISNLFIKNKNNGNIETEYSTIGKNLNLDSDGYSYTLSEDDFSVIDNTFTVKKENLLSDVTYENYESGATVISYDNNTSNGIFDSSCIINKYIFDSSIYTIPLTEKFGDSTVYDIINWTSSDNGIKHYSHITKAVYDKTTQSYSISTEGDGISDTSNGDNSSLTKFECFGISSDKCVSVLNINIPDNTGKNIAVYVNSTLITLQTQPTYRNSWCECILTKDPDNSLHYILTVNMEDNIPQISSGIDISTAKEYYSTPGTDNEAYGCDLFNMLLNGKTAKTSSRSITVTVKYEYGNDTIKSYYKMTQPGFTDNRRLPQINLKMNKDIESLEKSNNIDNGILCNQFQFFVDIDITDFEREYWGSYVQDSSLTLNFDITNCPIDYDFIERYGVQSSEETYTVHVNPVDSSNDFNDNYCSIKTFAVTNDIDDPYNMTCAELDGIDSSMINSENSEINEVFTSSYTNTEKIDLNGKSYIYMNNHIFPSEKATRGTGINDNILISMRGITFEQANKGKFRFRVMIEFGNPLFARLFYRFYVSNMWISYSGNKFHIGTTNLAKISQTGRYATSEFMFSTETMNTFICPVSMTAIPENPSIGMTTGTVKLAGSSKQIEISIDKYIPELSEEMSLLNNSAYVIQNQYIPWSDFRLKKSFLQDNIKNIYVQPIHISDYYEKISKYEPFFVIDGYDSIKSENNMDTYLSVVYNSNLYNQQLRDDVNTFYYNDELFKSEKYSQYSGKSPAFVSQSISYEVRDSSLLNSISVWNYEYQNIIGKTQSNVFTGHLTTYGNGYEYIDSTYDTGQYGDEFLNLETTKKYNEYMFFESPYNEDISYLYNKKAPDKGKWFRTLLYDISWKYPRYLMNTTTNTEHIDAYDIVSGGEYMNTWDNILKKKTSKYKLPYNIMYSIYPRCAYDYETDTNIVFMLRCPSVVSENKYEMEQSNQKKDLKIPFTGTYEKIQNDNMGIL